ncbi:hypothetical protein AB4Z52_25790 [Rhizobium sp. 2YAF20]|uniref:hypothetical protein n=1 Tax=Rhizobium sp. 2YAF20 TaxID=3233027 RepID=UPI003F94DD3C
MREKTIEPDVAVLSEALQQWYRYYEVPPGEAASDTLCGAALRLYNEGHRTVQEIATILIGTYVGISSTRVNAPTSQLVH